MWRWKSNIDGHVLTDVHHPALQWQPRDGKWQLWSGLARLRMNVLLKGPSKLGLLRIWIYEVRFQNQFCRCCWFDYLFHCAWYLRFQSITVTLQCQMKNCTYGQQRGGYWKKHLSSRAHMKCEENRNGITKTKYRRIVLGFQSEGFGSEGFESAIYTFTSPTWRDIKQTQVLLSSCNIMPDRSLALNRNKNPNNAKRPPVVMPAAPKELGFGS